MVMNCPACGSAVEKDAQFCPKCFERIQAPGLWKRFLSLFETPPVRSQRIVNLSKSVTIKTTDPGGQTHEYHSLAEAPPEVRAAMQELEAEAMKEAGQTTVSESSKGMFSEMITRKNVSIYRIKDASGKERVYHSLEELPPEIRAMIEQAEKKQL